MGEKPYMQPVATLSSTGTGTVSALSQTNRSTEQIMISPSSSTRKYNLKTYFVLSVNLMCPVKVSGVTTIRQVSAMRWGPQAWGPHSSDKKQSRKIQILYFIKKTKNKSRGREFYNDFFLQRIILYKYL